MSKAEGYPFIGPSTGLKVIIVGAGLGGLACAIECRRKGHEVMVFENAPEIMRIGDTLVHLTFEHIDTQGDRSKCRAFDLSMGNTSTY
jgi:monoamine oxidase